MTAYLNKMVMLMTAYLNKNGDIDDSIYKLCMEW